MRKTTRGDKSAPGRGGKARGAPAAPPPRANLPAVLPPSPPHLVLLLLLLLGSGLAAGYWSLHRAPPLPPGIASGNGRLEADEVDIDSKFAGRIARLFVDLPLGIRQRLSLAVAIVHRPEKIWANGLVILVAAGPSLYLVVRGLLHVPSAGSIPLFLCGVAIYLFFATAIGIFLGMLARSMPQLGLLYLLVYLPLAMLSGANTPLESTPAWLAAVMQAAPTMHFVAFAQAILYRGAGLAVVWPQFLLVALIGLLFLGLALARFRRVTAAATI